MADELMALRKGTRATRVAELQSEVFTTQMEMQRVNEINRVLMGRLADADAAAQQAVASARDARRKLDEMLSGGPSSLGDPPIRLADNNGIAAGSIRKTLQSMHQAHKLLMQQASLIRSVFPSGLEMAAFQEKARQRTNTAGAPDVLNFLRNHVAKVNLELLGQPGAPVEEDPMTVEPVAAKKKNAPAAKGTNLSTAQLNDSIANLARKLRSMDADRFQANPEFETSTEQLADLMQLCIDELNRLQGKNPAPPPPAAAPVAAPAPAQRAAPAPVADQPVAAAAAAPVPVPAPVPIPAPVPAPAPVPVPAPAPAAAAAPAPEPKDPVPYKVFVTTSDVSGGAFDGQVYIVLQGENGNSTEVQLPSDRYSFDTGEENEFAVSTEDVGKVNSIALRMEVTDSDSTWHLQKIRIQSNKVRVNVPLTLTVLRRVSKTSVHPACVDLT